MERLTMLLGQARFPLYALHPERWEGLSFIGSVGRHNVAAGGLHTLQLLYTDTDGAYGFLVSNISARVAAGPRVSADERLRRHLEAFVRCFPAPGRRRWFTGAPAVRERDFSARRRLLMVAGAERAVDWLMHESWPLEVWDTALREGEGVTDLVIAGWDHPIRNLARDVQPVTPALAATFDAAASIS